MKKFMAGLLSAVMVLEMTAAPISQTVSKIAEHKNLYGTAVEESSVVMTTEQIPTVTATETNYVVRSTQQREQTVETQVLSTGDLTYEAFREEFFQAMPNTSKVNPPSTQTYSLDFDTLEEGSNVTIVPFDHPEEELLPLTQVPSLYSAVSFPTYGFDSGETNEREFKVYNNTRTLTSVQGTLIAQGEHCNIWWINPSHWSNTGYSATNAPTFTAQGTEEQALATRIDSIYDKITENIAEHENVVVDYTGIYVNRSAIGDVDQDGRVNLILYDIYEDGCSSTPTSYAFTGGMYSANDFGTDRYTTGAAGILDTVYMDIGYYGGAVLPDDNTDISKLDGMISDSFYGTFAHEFQHLLFYTYFGALEGAYDEDSLNKDSDDYDYIWFNESLSGVVDIFYADYTKTGQNPQDLSSGRITSGSQNSYVATNYGDFVNFNNSLKNYGMSYMFSAMMNKYDTEYISTIYDYFIRNLKKNTEGNYSIEESITGEAYGATITGTKILGEIFQEVIGTEIAGFSALDPETAFEYVYSAFMECYASGGGDVIVDGDTVATTYEIWEEPDQTLWMKRDGNYYAYTSGGYIYSSGGTASYDTLATGNYFSLKGYGTPTTSGGATHETFYKLTMPSGEEDTLKITIPETSGLRAYVALYDDGNYLYESGSGFNNSYDISQDHADLYPLTLGVENYITITEEAGQDIQAYLFLTTFYDDATATVTYDWVDGNRDMTAPVITVTYDGADFTSDKSVEITTADLAAWTDSPFSATATDDVDGSVTVETTYSSVDSNGNSVNSFETAKTHLSTVDNTVTVTFTATDEAVNTATLDLTITAVAKMYKITLDANGGYFETSAITTKEENISSFESITGEPIREKYEFLGWTTDSNATEALTDLEFTQDTTLYAMWKGITVSEITLDSTSISLEIGAEKTLTATVTPENALNKELTWSSSAPDIATVENGKITAIKAGTATIIATSDSESSVTATCKVTVALKPVTDTNLSSKITEAVKGESPQNTGITGTGYTGTISWSPSVSDKFLGEIVYTATVALTADSNYTLEGVKFTHTGATSVTLSDTTLTIVFPETHSAVLSKIEVTSSPRKMEYVYGEPFDPTGMVVTATYDDGTTETVSDFTHNGADLAVGTTSVTITYQGKTAKVTISVSKAVQTAPNSVTGSYAVSTNNSEEFAYTIAAIVGGEYSKDGTNWQDSNIFDNLTPETTSTFYGRMKETDNYEASPSSQTEEIKLVKLENDKKIDLEYNISEVDSTKTLTITEVTGAEYSFDGGATWATDNTKTLTGEEESVTISIRYKATATLNASTEESALVYTSLKVQTITMASIQGKTYGDEEITLALSSKGEGATGEVTFESSDDTIISISGNTATIKGAGDVTITAMISACPIYNEATTSITVSVAKATLTLTAEDKEVEQGGAMPTFTYTVTGLVGSDAVTTDPTLTSNATDSTTSGFFDITASGASAGSNYTITYVNGKLTITKKEVVVDKSDLTSAISSASSSASKITVATEASQVESGTKWILQADLDSYQTAIALAQAVEDQSDATQEEVDGAVSALSSATSAFVSAQKTGTQTTETPETNTNYTVFFNGNGGTASSSSKETGEDGTLSSLPTATRTNYYFNGWYTASSDGRLISTSTIFTADTTVYAQWTYSGASSDTEDDTTDDSTDKEDDTTEDFTDKEDDTTEDSTDTEDDTTEDSTDTEDDTTDDSTDTDDDTTDDSTEETPEKEEIVPATPEGSVILDVITQLPIIQTMTPSTYADMGNTQTWYYPAVVYVSERGLMTGTTNGNFAPDIDTSRAMIVQVLYNLADKPPVPMANFNDVHDGDWYADAISWASSLNIANGVSTTSFSPDGDMTREQLFVMLYAFDKLISGEAEVEASDLIGFSDISDMSPWALESAAWAVSRGVVSGIGDTISPHTVATRAQLAVILEQFISLYN